MEVQAASWSSPTQHEHGPLSPPGDVGITEQRDQPRHASQSLDQQAADILKLFGEATEDSPAMDFGAFSFDDTLTTHFGALQHGNGTTHIDHSNSDSSNSSSTCDSNNMVAHQHFGSWPTMMDPHSFGYEQTALQPGPPWASEPRLEQRPMTFPYYGGEGLGIHMPPTSNSMGNTPLQRYNAGYAGHHPSPIDTCDGYGRTHFSQGWQQIEQNIPLPEDIFGDEVEGEEGVDSADPCYAQLLHKCLKDAPNHTLSLRELYEWVSLHSQKAKDPSNRGWQNSVRHNLSMNAAFQRVTDRSTSSSKKGSLWRLTDDALRDGVISTTRYRKDPKRKPERRSTPAPNRQISGAKGGRATRDASRMRQQRSGLSHHHRFNSPQGPYSPYSIAPSPVGHPYPPAINHGLPIISSSEPASPYFLNQQDDTSPYAGYHQATPEDFLQPPSKVAGFEFMPLRSNEGLFGDQDPELVGEATPGMTEASFDG